MKSYSIYEAKTNFSRLVREVLVGKKIIITYRGKPIIEFVPIQSRNKKKRKLGTMKGA